MRRRIKEEGKSFGKIKEELRFVIEKKILKEKKLRIEEVEDEIGYREKREF